MIVIPIHINICFLTSEIEEEHDKKGVVAYKAATPLKMLFISNGFLPVKYEFSYKNATPAEMITAKTSPCY